LFLRALRHERCKVFKGENATSTYLVEKAGISGSCVATEEGFTGNYTLHLYLRKIEDTIDTNASLISTAGANDK
jgi:hypothetical protein